MSNQVDRVVREVQADPADLQLQDRVCQQQSQQLKNQEHLEGPEALEAPEAPADQVDRVCHISLVFIV